METDPGTVQVDELATELRQFSLSDQGHPAWPPVRVWIQERLRPYVERHHPDRSVELDRLMEPPDQPVPAAGPDGGRVSAMAVAQDEVALRAYGARIEALCSLVRGLASRMPGGI